MCESQTGGNGKAAATKCPNVETSKRQNEGAGDPLALAHAIVTAAMKCRDNTSETEIPFVVGIRRIESGCAIRFWSLLVAEGSYGVRMEPVPDHRDIERVVLLFFRMANAEG